MKGKRTGIDFSKHELAITDTEGLLVHHLFVPNTNYDNIKYINTNGIMVVTGDYGNYIFCREFHPSAKGGVDSGYWREKMQLYSCQIPLEYDSESTKVEIQKLLSENDDLTEDEIEYLEECLYYVDDEIEYNYHAFRKQVGRFGDYENVPDVKKYKGQVPFIFDGFDEICRRLKEKEEIK